MITSYKWLETYFSEKLPSVEDLADKINSHVFEVEGMEKKDNDTAIDLKVMPDRSHHALCHKGIAREVRALLNLEMKKSEVNEVVSDKNVSDVEVLIEEKTLCRRYMARRFDGVEAGESPSWIRERLEAVGARSINKIVDITNFVMLDIGQPLHAFDADKVVGSIRVRKATAGEKIVLLDGRELELGVSDLVIADDEGPLAIAGVKGGKRAEVSASTKSIIVESANFNPVSVRRTSTRLNLRNDSSKRFENDIIPELALDAMKLASSMIMDFCPGAKAGKVCDVFVKGTEPWTVKVPTGYVSSRLGIDVDDKEVVTLLSLMDCKVTVSSDLVVEPPLDRLDLKIAEDFVDEVARIKGYEQVKSSMPPLFEEKTSPDPSFLMAEKTKNILVRQGFSEVLLYSLANKGHFEISYPLASDKSALRENIIHKMKDTLSLNSLNADLVGLDAIKVFEIGKVFPKNGEMTVLAIGAVPVKKKKGVTAESIVKNALDELKKGLGMEKDLPIIGKIDVSQNGAVVEIDFDKLVSENIEKAKGLGVAGLDFVFLPKEKKYVPFSPYPFIVRDVAVFVPADTESATVWQVIMDGIKESKSESLLVRHSLFDTYSKDGKISYAFRLVLQSFERTLKDEEANAVMEAVYAKLKEKNWEVR